MTVHVYIAASLDGYIADRNGSLDWLTGIQDPSGGDFGFAEFISGIDAVVMGRKTFDTVVDFEPWPYPKPVFVLSNTLKELPARLAGKCELIHGTPAEIIHTLAGRGLNNLYVDGGQTIQSFLSGGLVDEMVITRIPILLGGGAPLFGSLDKPIHFEFLRSESLPPGIQKNYYRLFPSK
jgi:dihydrofolate reductase